MVSINSNFARKVQNYIQHSPAKLQNAINETQSITTFIIQREFHRTLSRNPSDKKDLYEG